MSQAEPTPIRRPRADRARQVADVLRQQIHLGAYDDGLPSEQALAAEFFVSRNTIGEALAVLKNEGLIDRGPKVGTHVAVRKYDHGLDALVGLKETFKDYGEVHNEVRAVQHLAAPPAVARRLCLKPGGEVVFIERLRYLGDLPLSLDLTYLAPDIGELVLQHPLETNDVFALRGGQRAASRLGNPCAGSSSGRPTLCGDAAGAGRVSTADAGAPHQPRRRETRGPGIHPNAR